VPSVRMPDAIQQFSASSSSLAMSTRWNGPGRTAAFTMCCKGGWRRWTASVPKKLTIDALVHRVHQGGVKEIIMATNPTLEGDGTALYISNLLAGSNVKMTRLARGLPSGSVLEFANTQMLADALEGRRTF